MVQWTVESLLQTLVDSNYSIEGQTSRLNSKPVKGVSSLYDGTSTDVSFYQAEGASAPTAKAMVSPPPSPPRSNSPADDFDGGDKDDSKEKGILAIARSNAGVILCKKSMEGQLYPNRKKDQVLIFVDNPRFEFTRIAKKINSRNNTLTKVGISPSAVIADSAKIGRDCYIGDHVVIGDDCIIGDNTKVESKVNLQNCIIGDDCIIQPNTTIGCDGFAFERCIDTLELEQFPHYGKVIIENGVEIYANCSIARGSLSDTTIGQGAHPPGFYHIDRFACHFHKYSERTY